jgi:hypothetical protein
MGVGLKCKLRRFKVLLFRITLYFNLLMALLRMEGNPGPYGVRAHEYKPVIIVSHV